MTTALLKRIIEDLTSNELGYEVSDIVSIQPIKGKHSFSKREWLVVCKQDQVGIHCIYDNFGKWVGWSL